MRSITPAWAVALTMLRRESRTGGGLRRAAGCGPWGASRIVADRYMLPDRRCEESLE
jgi:hypothetical protein